jgi:carbonic anhydrase
LTDLQPTEYGRLLAENERHAEQFERASLRAAPLAAIAILTCMDARIVVEDIFGLRAGDANVIRNAGAVASDDAIRSLILSQQLLGTNEVIVLGHTDCGLRDLGAEELRVRLARSFGQPSEIRFGSFHDLDEHVARQAQRIRDHPWTKPVAVHELVYDVATGRVREVDRSA